MSAKFETSLFESVRMQLELCESLVQNKNNHWLVGNTIQPLQKFIIKLKSDNRDAVEHLRARLHKLREAINYEKTHVRLIPKLYKSLSGVQIHNVIENFERDGLVKRRESIRVIRRGYSVMRGDGQKGAGDEVSNVIRLRLFEVEPKIVDWVSLEDDGSGVITEY